MMLERLAAALFALLIIVTLLGVADRYAMGLGLTWTEELSRFILIWLSMIAAIIAMWRGAHFRVELLISLLGRGYAILVSLACIALALLTAWYGIELALKFHNQTSPALGWSMGTIYAAVPIGFIGMAVAIALGMLRPDLAEEDGQS